MTLAGVVGPDDKLNQDSSVASGSLAKASQ
jgi:hypothetical protein